ncbi:MAG: MBL fold metallo-hydrolase [Candidatus Lokiarchaeota archaeon]|jgi:glyoxylase-like metal-dependent hydrolase (beta-lactamase superfamily II)
MTNNQHFEISKLKDYIYVIKENISNVHPVYTNDPLNIYLLLGTDSALLVDTGCGLSPLKSIIKKLIDHREIIVVNSHTHWDHVLGNEEFGIVYVHENEAQNISQPYNISYFRDSPNKLVIKKYENQHFLIPPAKVIKTFKDQDEFHLGGLKVKIIHSPGHSPGSICLLTSKSELFTSDVAYYGDIFLPKRQNFPQVLETLEKLITLCNRKNITELYPSHRKTPCDINLLIELRDAINNIDDKWDKRKEFDFFNAWQIENDKFGFYVSKT